MSRACRVCSEKIQPAGKDWIHTHTGEVNCGCGDGSLAEPRTPCPRCGSLWNTTALLTRTRFACFACLLMWWSLDRES